VGLATLIKDQPQVVFVGEHDPTLADVRVSHDVARCLVSGGSNSGKGRSSQQDRQDKGNAQAIHDTTSQDQVLGKQADNENPGEMLHGSGFGGKVNPNQEWNMVPTYPAPAIFDVLNSPGTGREVDILERIAGLHGCLDADGPALWLEPACGTGRYLRSLLRRGHRVAGFDLDSAMLDYARRRRDMDGAVLFQADMTDFLGQARKAGIAPRSVDVAFNPVNSLRHLAGDDAVISHLDGMARLLKPRGISIVGLSLADYRWLEAEEDLWTGARGRIRVSQLVNYLPPEPGTERARSETVISHLTIERPRGTKHLDHRYDLRTYDARQWADLIDGTSLRIVASYDAAGRPLDGRLLPYQLEVLTRR